MDYNRQYENFDKVFWTTGLVPTVPSTEYKSDGSWLVLVQMLWLHI